MRVRSDGGELSSNHCHDVAYIAQIAVVCSCSVINAQIPREQFPRNFLVANLTRKSPTCYKEVGRVGHISRMLATCQTILTCQDGLACR